MNTVLQVRRRPQVPHYRSGATCKRLRNAFHDTAAIRFEAARASSFLIRLRRQNRRVFGVLVFGLVFGLVFVTWSSYRGLVNRRLVNQRLVNQALVDQSLVRPAETRVCAGRTND